MTKRLDPDYYAPQHLHDEEAIFSLGAIQLGTTGKLFAGPFGSELPTSVFVDDGVPLFRVGNVGGMEVDENDLAQISQALHQKLSASEVVPGDVLIVKASVGEKICIVPDSMPLANITQHIIGLHPNGSVDERYVAAALFSAYGSRQVQRRALGAIIQYLGVGEARTVLLPDLGKQTQAYIGNKVRQAEALRARACSIRYTVNSELDELVGNTTMSKMSWRTNASELEAYRLNPKHYDPLVLGAIQRVSNNGGTALLREVIGSRKLAGGATPLGAVYETKGIHFLRVQNVKPWALNHADAAYISKETDESIKRSRCRIDDIVLTITGYPGTAALVTETDLPANINQHSVRFGVRIGWPPGYIVAAINSRFVQLQVARFAIGGTRDALDYTSVASLHLPVLGDVAMLRVDSRVRETIAAEQQTQALTTAARLLIEALIERKITEAELIAAHKDPAADRALLARLTEDGLDVAVADPLFPDLDRLDELLAEARQGESQ